jgi:hypothetical protein
MGDTLAAAQDAEVEFSVHVVGVDGAKVVFVEDGRRLAEVPDIVIHGSDQTVTVPWKSDGKQHWFRSDVHGPDDKLWLIGNPIYIDWVALKGKGSAP